MGRYVKNDMVDKVLLRDLPSLYGIKDVQELNRFFTYIAYNTGNEFSNESMSRESGIQKETLKKALDQVPNLTLEKMNHIVGISKGKTFILIIAIFMQRRNSPLIPMLLV